VSTIQPYHYISVCPRLVELELQPQRQVGGCHSYYCHTLHYTTSHYTAPGASGWGVVGYPGTGEGGLIFTNNSSKFFSRLDLNDTMRYI